jgi:carbamoyl-phosphate synthase small subunit
MNRWESILYLENGHFFSGLGFGAPGMRGGELVFNTGMTGYQEVFTDPSYARQIVLMTYPELGNTGINDEDIESNGQLYLSGVVGRRYCDVPSNWRSTRSLGSYLEQAGVPGIHGLDTREVVQILRQEGAQRAVIFPKADGGKDTLSYAKKLVAAVPSMEGLELVSEVSCKAEWCFTPEKKGEPVVVVYDYGVKYNILRGFAERGFNVWVVPHNFPYQSTLALNPVAVVLSNGPGDPGRVQGAVEQIQGLLGRVPIFAICMGHQLLGRALGAGTYKLKFGHHGINHPVRDNLTGQILITSQNHGFCVDEKELLSRGYSVSHVNLNDGTVEGMVSDKDRFYSVQFHPEAKPGPNDANSLFDNFLRGFLR